MHVFAKTNSFTRNSKCIILQKYNRLPIQVSSARTCATPWVSQVQQKNSLNQQRWPFKQLAVTLPTWAHEFSWVLNALFTPAMSSPGHYPAEFSSRQVCFGQARARKLPGLDTPVLLVFCFFLFFFEGYWGRIGGQRCCWPRWMETSSWTTTSGASTSSSSVALASLRNT